MARPAIMHTYPMLAVCTKGEAAKTRNKAAKDIMRAGGAVSHGMFRFPMLRSLSRACS